MSCLGHCLYSNTCLERMRREVDWRCLRGSVIILTYDPEPDAYTTSCIVFFAGMVYIVPDPLHPSTVQHNPMKRPQDLEPFSTWLQRAATVNYPAVPVRCTYM